MGLKGPSYGYEDNSAPTRGGGATTPGFGQKYRDPIRGKQSDDYFAIGGQSQDISAKLDREAGKRRNGANGR